jgi:hypothetical protein
MKFVKKHKFKLIGAFVFLLLMIFAFIGIKELIYPDTHKDLYGNRLEGIEDVRISQDKLGKIKLSLQSTDDVSNVIYDIKGRIVNFIITVNSDTDLITSKSLADKIMEDFTVEEKNYYDFQVYIINSKDEESELYPIIGYKHKTSLSFKWTNN